MTEKRYNTFYFFQYITFFLLLLLCLYRAATLSLTHDESSTWLYIHERNIWSTLFTSEAWPTANNHYLNSILLHISESIFGNSDFAIRLPNLLAFALYGGSAICIINNLFHNRGPQILAFSLLFFNPYLIDFFSLARGYGLSLGWLMLGLALLIKWNQNRRNIYLWGVYMSLLLSTLSLFTHVLYLPAITASIWILLLLEKMKLKSLLKNGAFYIPVISMAITGSLIYVPIQALSGNAEFRWGTPKLSETFLSLMNDSLMGKKYLGQHTETILLIVIGSMITIGMLMLFSKWATASNIKLKPNALVALIFILLLIELILAKMVLGSLYPIDRKSLMLLPILVLLIPYTLDKLPTDGYFTGIGIGASMFILLHFFTTLEVDRTREWYYDYKTKDYVQAIAKDAAGVKVNICENWAFHWTAKYYIINGGHKNINQRPYNKNVDDSGTCDYYILPLNEYENLESAYTLMSGPDKSKVLVAKKK